MIAEDVKLDTRKLYPAEAFESGLTGENSLKSFVAKRREYLLKVTAAAEIAACGGSLTMCGGGLSPASATSVGVEWAPRMGHPDSRSATKSEPGSALDWAAVLEGEYHALYGVKPFEGTGPSDPDERLKALHLLMHQRRPSALCLSGGGIRSATFGLGVVQALAHTGILGKLDYLSTVSGGGYIGGWLTTWLHREGRSAVIQGLDPAFANAMGGEAARLSPVERLRATCRYLAPQGGLVSADVWTLLATIGRNLFLNWLVLLPLLAAALLIPRLYLAAVQVLEQNVMIPNGRGLHAGRRRSLLAIPRIVVDVRRRPGIRGDELRRTR